MWEVIVKIRTNTHKSNLIYFTSVKFQHPGPFHILDKSIPSYFLDQEIAALC